MREKELRLAIVCSGGISLAVYMHGLTRELLKLSRASSFYHAVPEVEAKQTRPFASLTPPPGQTMDTEAVYYDLLQDVGAEVDLRVIIDVIAGASAGGINGVILGRALAHDLSFSGLRKMWLEGSDVRELVAEEDRSNWADKLLAPLVRWISGGRLAQLEQDSETLGKFISLLQIARLKPPFDGTRLIQTLMQALEGMGKPEHRGSSLLPQGHELDLLVTVTDFYGYPRRIPIYDPPVIEEKEHRHVLSFSYVHWPSGDEHSEFRMEDIPALSFAARATSSFPGLFPAARLDEVDEVLAAQDQQWAGKQAFIERSFRDHARGGANPETSAFVDGAVLNNKPLDAAITAIQTKPAYRNVDRRLLYINPNPGDVEPSAEQEAPGVLEAVKSSLSDLPRHEPIYDDLMWIRQNNYEVAQTEAIIEAARPDIEKLVSKLMGRRATRYHVTTDQIERWRNLANHGAAETAGIAYKGYLRLKLNSSIVNITAILADICDVSLASPEASFIRQAVNEWAHMRQAYPEDFGHLGRGGRLRSTPAWLRLLRGFDVDFRQRRIRFVIKHLNHLYTRLDEPDFKDLNAYRLDYLKGRFYEVLEYLRQKQKTAAFSLDATSRIQNLFLPELESDELDPAQGVDFARKHGVALDTIIESLSRDLTLETMNYQADDIFSSMEHTGAGGSVRQELLTQYLGFSYWDTLTFSAGSWRQQAEQDEIRVSRLSPQDCTALRDTGPDVLQGIRMGNFGAFFRRADRENDYLWGRLHAADRLLDMVYDAAKTAGAGERINILAYKKRAFEVILETEAQHLTHSDELLETLRAEVAALAVD